MVLRGSDEPRPTSFSRIQGDHELSHDLAPRLGEIAKFSRRREWLGSELEREVAERVAELTFGLEYGSCARDAPGPGRLRAVAWNVQRGRQLDGIAASLQGQPELAGASFVLLSECDVGMARSDNRNVARELARRLGYHYVFGNHYLCLGAGNAREASAVGSNQLSLAGNAILSRFPVRRAESFSLTVSEDKFESSEKRLGHKKALLVEADLGGSTLPLVAVHFDSAASAELRAHQMRDVVQKLREHGLDQRVLIGGDFNTTTYDANHVPALLLSLARKFSKGGFPHAIEHYLHPDRLYERALFGVLDEAGFDYARLNALGVGTLRYEVGEAGSEGRVRDFLPEFAVRYLKKKLAPWGGVVGLKVDWFAGRGLEVVRAGTVTRPMHAGEQVSDHDPIWVEFSVS